MMKPLKYFDNSCCGDDHVTLSDAGYNRSKSLLIGGRYHGTKQIQELILVPSARNANEV